MGFKKAFSTLILALPLVLGLRTKRATCPDGVNTAVNAQCCFLFPIADDLINNMMDGICGDSAHGALRLLFHDAIGISPTLGGGGADGSIIVFNATELTFHANIGIDDILDDVQPFVEKYADVLTPGDFIQFAGALSLFNCAGAPRVQFMLGRPPPIAASPPGLVPEPTDNIDVILARFAQVDFTTQEVVSLIASHSSAGADDIDPAIPGTPFDSTPEVFDTQIFVEVALRGTMFSSPDGANPGEVETAIAGTLRLQSDSNFARDSATSCDWQNFVNNQALVQEIFGASVFKLSLLGQNPDNMIDCSEVIPQPLPFTGEAVFPPGLTNADIEQACATSSFPILSTQPGPPTTVPAIPQD